MPRSQAVTISLLLRATLCAIAIALTTPLAARDLARPDSYSDTLSLMREALAANPAVSDLTIDLADNSLHLSLDGLEHVIYPDNLHNDLRNADGAADRGLILNEFVAAILEPVNLDEVTLSPDEFANLRPVLRNVGLWDGIETSSPMVEQDFAGDLAVFWVINSPLNLTYVSASMLTESKISQEEVQQRALENLATLAAQAKWVDITPKAAFLQFDGLYESSFVLVPEVWRSFRGWRSLVMAVPDREFFILADGSDPETVDMLRGLARDIAEKNGIRLSAGIYRFDGSGWVAH